MNTFLPPSKSPVSEHQIERFNKIYQKMHARLGPGNEVEHSLCDEIIVGLWHYRSFRSKAQNCERIIHQLTKTPDTPATLQQAYRALKSALRQAKLQKNFAWRRRSKFFEMKTLRENLEKLPKAA